MESITTVQSTANSTRECANQTWTWIELIHENTPNIIDRVITPFIYVIGFFGNIAAIKIWKYTTSRRDNTSALYLITLACTDLAFLFIHSINELQEAWGVTTRNVPVFCELFAILYMVPQYISPLLVLGFTVERFVSIMRPFKSERFARRNRTGTVISILVIFAILQALPQSYIWTYDGYVCDGRGNLFCVVWTWGTEILTFAVLPLITLVLNVCVLRVSRKIPNIRTECSVNSSKNKNNRRRQNAVSTVTLLCVSFYRIFSQVPATITYAVQKNMAISQNLSCLTVAEVVQEPEMQAYFNFFTARIAIAELGLAYHACNVFIYCITAQHFRNHLKTMLACLISCPYMQGSMNAIQMQSTMTEPISNTSKCSDTDINKQGTLS